MNERKRGQNNKTAVGYGLERNGWRLGEREESNRRINKVKSAVGEGGRAL
jgi:hypothetical protein